MVEILFFILTLVIIALGYIKEARFFRVIESLSLQIMARSLEEYQAISSTPEANDIAKEYEAGADSVPIETYSDIPDLGGNNG